jgi:hypothetical protein
MPGYAFPNAPEFLEIARNRVTGKKEDTVITAMTTMDMTDTAFAHQTGIAFATVYAIQLLKNSKWFPWLQAETDTVNRVVSLVVAFLTAAGIKFAMDGTFDHGWVFTIQVPSIGVVLDTLVHFTTQFGMQEVIYQSTKKAAAAKTVAVTASVAQPVAVSTPRAAERDCPEMMAPCL